MKKFLTFAMTMLMLVFVSCTSNAQSAKSQKKDSDNVEVMYFHGKYGCATCKAIGKYSKEVVEQLGDSGIIWREVDLTTPEGERLGDKYEIVGSGLVVAKGKKWTDLTEMGFKYVLSDAPKFSNELKSEIQKIQK